MTRRSTRVLTALTAVVLVAACAGPAAIDAWVQGPWECSATTPGGGGAMTATVDVADGTWSATLEGSETASFNTAGRYEGTWDLGGGTLVVSSQRDANGTVSGVPGTDEELSGVLTGAWGDGGSVSVSLATDSVSISHTDPYSGNVTTTVCAKA